MKTIPIILLLMPMTIASSQPVAYPLHLGDRWEYTGVDGIVNSARIDQDTVMPNGYRYVMVEYNNSAWTYYERQEGNRIFRYDLQAENENLWFDFDLSYGDTVNSIPYGSDTTDIHFSGTNQDTIFGVSRRKWYFFIDYDRQMIDDEQLLEITDTLGLTRMDWQFGYSTLRCATINGSSYGTITGGIIFTNSNLGVFQLEQNYPNPFNPGTTISFVLTSSSLVTLRIYDMLGREVAKLLNEDMNPGVHKVRFEGTQLTSGIYLYRLQTNQSVETKAMLLIK